MPRLDRTTVSIAGWTEPIGFIGLGDMGAPMAFNLASAGLDVFVFDPRSDAAAACGGVTLTESSAEVGAKANVICICVVTDAQVEEVVSELLTVARPGQVYVVHSSVSPATIERVAQRAQQQGVELIDAAVSGTRTASIAGTLTLMVGGARDAVERCLPMFSVIAEAIFYVGAAGRGQVVKMANNMLFQANHLIVLEALRLSQSFGIDEQDVIDVVQASTGRSWITEFWGFLDRQMQEHTLAGTEAMYGLMTKEQRNALMTAQDRAVSLPITALAVQLSRFMLDERSRHLAGRPEQ